MASEIPNYDYFRTQYSEALEGLGVTNDPTFFLIDLLTRYNEGRAYHNLDHLISVLARINCLIPEDEIDGRTHNIARIAAFYHDAVYVPGWKLNESLSWEYCDTHLRYLSTPSPHFGPIERAIMATRDHILVMGQEPSRLLIDADLFGLGTDDYARNGKNVRAEFSHVPEHLWVAGRKKFLHTYLNRDQLYYSPDQYDLEVKARQNMERELVELIESGV